MLHFSSNLFSFSDPVSAFGNIENDFLIYAKLANAPMTFNNKIKYFKCQQNFTTLGFHNVFNFGTFWKTACGKIDTINNE